MDSDSVPAWLVKWGDISWRLIAIGVAVYFGFRALTTISVVVLSVVVAMFLAAVLWKPSNWLRDRGLPPALASMLTLAGAVAVIVGVIVLIIPQVADNVDSLSESVGELVGSIREWLITGPLGLTDAEIDSYWESLTEWLQGTGGESIVGGATAVLELITGTFLAVIVFFGAFIPLVGAFISGLLAVAVAFVNGGLTDGLIILAVIIGVQQFEGDVIMPLVFGQTLRLHPLVILLGVAAGGLAFGLFGAFLAIPLVAVAVAINEAVGDDPDSGYLSLARG